MSGWLILLFFGRLLKRPKPRLPALVLVQRYKGSWSRKWFRLRLITLNVVINANFFSRNHHRFIFSLSLILISFNWNFGISWIYRTNYGWFSSFLYFIFVRFNLLSIFYVLFVIKIFTAANIALLFILFIFAFYWIFGELVRFIFFFIFLSVSFVEFVVALNIDECIYIFDDFYVFPVEYLVELIKSDKISFDYSNMITFRGVYSNSNLPTILF